MATHLRNTTTIYSIAEICDAIAGALELDDKTKHLAEIWSELTKKADAQAEEQKQSGRRLRRARTRVQVQDAIWDPEVAGAFGRAVVDASNGKRDIPPYTRFFKELPPSEVRQLKPDDEVKFGKAAITELTRDINEPLAITWIPRLTVANNALVNAVEARATEEEGQAALYRSRDLLLQEVNIALDVLEGDLKKLFPGDPKRVASYLSATQTSDDYSDKTKEKKKEPTPT